MIRRLFRKDTPTESRLHVGLLLYLNTFDDSIADTETVFKSRIADLDENLLAIEMPIEEGTGRMKFFPRDTELTASFFEEDGMKYSFSTKTVGRRNDNIPLLLLEKPEPERIIKIQRRDYLRVPIRLELEIKFKGQEEGVVVETVDVSGGGLAFICHQPIAIEPGQLLSGCLKIPHPKAGTEAIEFTAVVVRTAEPTEERPVRFAAIQYIDIEERKRDRIIRLCFQREIELSRKLNTR